MKSSSLLALLAITVLAAGCASSGKSSSSNNSSSPSNSGDLPVAANNSNTDTTQSTTPATSTASTTTSTTTSPSTSGSTSSVPPVLIDYTVVSGDSLWKIAHDHGTTVGKIKRINNLTTDNLSIGQKIKVPQVASNQ